MTHNKHKILTTNVEDEKIIFDIYLCFPKFQGAKREIASVISFVLFLLFYSISWLKEAILVITELLFKRNFNLFHLTMKFLYSDIIMCLFYTYLFHKIWIFIEFKKEKSSNPYVDTSGVIIKALLTLEILATFFALLRIRSIPIEIVYFIQDFYSVGTAFIRFLPFAGEGIMLFMFSVGIRKLLEKKYNFDMINHHPFSYMMESIYYNENSFFAKKLQIIINFIRHMIDTYEKR